MQFLDRRGMGWLGNFYGEGKMGWSYGVKSTFIAACFFWVNSWGSQNAIITINATTAMYSVNIRLIILFLVVPKLTGSQRYCLILKEYEPQQQIDT